MKTIRILVLLLLTVPAHAETWTLLPGLTVSPPDTLDVTFQSNEESGLEGDHIWGWKGEEPDYMVIPSEWEKGFAGTLSWKVMLADIKNDSENSDFKIIEEGEYETSVGSEIEYKLIEYLNEGTLTTQLVISIENDNGAFILIGSSFSDDRAYLVKSMKVLANNAAISK